LKNDGPSFSSTDDFIAKIGDGGGDIKTGGDIGVGDEIGEIILVLLKN